MSNSRRSTRPAASRLAALSIPALLVLAATASGQTTDPPPRSDTITAISQFLACKGNPYALCYYSGPAAEPVGTEQPVPALPCRLGDDERFADCTCYAIEDGTSTNYVAIASILNPEIRRRTEEVCHSSGRHCLNLVNERHCAKNPGDERCRTAPVCAYLGNVASGTGQSLYPEGALVSTFSFEHAWRYPISSTDCSEEPYTRYAGCMTAACEPAFSSDGFRLTRCACPTFVGPFQYGQSGSNLQCELEDSHVWSAANATVSLPAPDALDAEE